MNEIDFSMQELMNLMGRQTLNVNAIAETVGEVARGQKELKTEVKELRGMLVNEIEERKNTTFINGRERRILRGVASERIYALLDIPKNKKLRTNDDELSVQRYSSLFHARIYSDAKRESRMGEDLDCTLHTDFDEVLRYLKSWNPACGVDALKREADRNAMARRSAREDGYR